MLKGIPADVWVVAVAGMAVYMALGASFELALFNVILCINAAKQSPLLSMFSKK